MRSAVATATFEGSSSSRPCLRPSARDQVFPDRLVETGLPEIKTPATVVAPGAKFPSWNYRISELCACVVLVLAAPSIVIANLSIGESATSRRGTRYRSHAQS